MRMDSMKHFTDVMFVQLAPIKFLKLGRKQIRQIATLSKPEYDWGGLSLSPDGKWLAYSQVDDTPADILLVENFR